MHACKKSLKNIYEVYVSVYALQHNLWLVITPKKSIFMNYISSLFITMLRLLVTLHYILLAINSLIIYVVIFQENL